MSLCKSLSVSRILLSTTVIVVPLFANMRAPVHVEHGSSELRGMPADLRVLGETLDFQCPEAYKGKPDFAAFAARACRVRVLYRISATAATQVKLVFVFAGKGEVTWKHGGKAFNSRAAALKSADKKVCRYCPEDMKNIQAAEQVLDIVPGNNEIEVSYDQALSYDESGHSYFSDGKWSQGFSYELWPLAEWQWAPDFSAELKFSVAARSGFLGIGYKDDKMQCDIEENGKFTPVALNIGKAIDDRRTAMARITLKKRPERLRCSYAAD